MAYKISVTTDKDGTWFNIREDIIGASASFTVSSRTVEGSYRDTIAVQLMRVFVEDYNEGRANVEI